MLDREKLSRRLYLGAIANECLLADSIAADANTDQNFANNNLSPESARKMIVILGKKVDESNKVIDPEIALSIKKARRFGATTYDIRLALGLPPIEERKTQGVLDTKSIQ